MAMERVSTKKNQLGFSCGKQFVMTPAIAFKVSFDEMFWLIYNFLFLIARSY